MHNKPTHQETPGMSPIRNFAPLCIGALLFSASFGINAQNLVVNGDFDNDLSGWTVHGVPSPAWSDFDVSGAPTSGSVHALNEETAPGIRLLVLSQCVVVTQPGSYLFGATGFTPSGQSTGNLVASYTARATPNCQGGSFNGGGFYLPSIDVWTTYTSGALLNIPAPMPADVSIEILLSVDKIEAGASFGGHFDSVFLIHHESIFNSGFE